MFCYPHFQVIVHVTGDPVHNLVNQQGHFFLHTLHCQAAPKAEESDYPAPLDSVAEQLVDNGCEGWVRSVRGDVELVTHLLEDLCVPLFELQPQSPHGQFNPARFWQLWGAQPRQSLRLQSVLDVVRHQQLRVVGHLPEISLLT